MWQPSCGGGPRKTDHRPLLCLIRASTCCHLPAGYDVLGTLVANPLYKLLVHWMSVKHSAKTWRAGDALKGPSGGLDYGRVERPRVDSS
ncbi:hypothetical protein Nepgr_033427 [Nepenthes gracilis]|uniref:Uncharacterized protein n=1 Tax=Nepenthes gracilis TaxID=150966 RepID=A0AAD3TMC4_NEPGR|nr:hypothetical protein Nepgr_033427 [Nepenthes gracilis]